MGDRKLFNRSFLPTLTGAISVGLAILGFLAFGGYGSFAARGILLAATRDPIAAYRTCLIAGDFTLAQFILGLLAIILGGTAIIIGKKSNSSDRLGRAALCIGGVDLLLLLVLV